MSSQQLSTHQIVNGYKFPQLAETLRKLFKGTKKPTNNEIEALLQAFLQLVFDCQLSFTYLYCEDGANEDEITQALGFCKRRFEQHLAKTKGRVQGLLKGLNFEDSWHFVWRTVMPKLYEEFGTEADSFAAWGLFRWFYQAVSHRRVRRVLSSMQNTQAVWYSGPVEDFWPHCVPDNFSYEELDDLLDAFEEDFEDKPEEFEDVNLEAFTHPITTESADTECPICRDADQNDLVALNQCNHVFHAECFQSWANLQSGSKSVTCPMCRGTVCERVLKGVQLTNEGVEVTDDSNILHVIWTALRDFF